MRKKEYLLRVLETPRTPIPIPKPAWLWRAAIGTGIVALWLGWLAVDGAVDELARADVALVLGTTVYPTGKPSPWLRARLDRAASLYRAGWIPAILVSGGVGREGVAEAEAMKSYLVETGIPAPAIATDNLGVNTWMSAKGAAQWLRLHRQRRVLVITTWFHIPRAKLALERHGVPEVYSAHARWLDVGDAVGWVRESIAWFWYRIRWDTEISKPRVNAPATNLVPTAKGISPKAAR